MIKKLYFIPGTMCDIRLWEKLWSYFGKGYELIHIAIPHANSIDEMLELLNENLPDKLALLTGFSLGGYLASAFMLRYPNRVKQLVVIANTSCKLSLQEVNERRTTIEWLEKGGRARLKQTKITKLLHSSNKSNEQLVSLIFNMNKDLGEHTLLNQLKATTVREDLTEKILKTNLQILYCVGNEDSFVDPTFFNKMFLGHKNVKIERVEGAGHMLPLEQPFRLAQLIMDRV